MKNILAFLLMLSVTFAFAQNDRDLKLNKETNLIEVAYYHDNGVVSQTGFYTLDGELQGEWLSYDVNGKKTASANYINGKKSGKWFFWSENTLREIDYDNNKIANVVEWKSTETIADSN